MYVGKMTDPTPALFLVDTDANDGFGVIAINLAQAVDEYGDSMLIRPTLVYPALQIHAFMALLLCGDWLEAGHALQTASEFAAKVVEYRS